MEFKKKTIIWEDNNEPPKNYIWVKSDGKSYEYDLTTKAWVESETVKMVDSEEETPDESEETTPDTSYEYLSRTGKLPKYFWMYYNNEEIKKEIFGSDIIIDGDYQSPTGKRLVVDFAKVANLGTIAKFMTECHLGSPGFGVIYEKEDNFELTGNDIRTVSIFKGGDSLEVKVKYFGDQFTFDSSKVYETEIDGVLYYEYAY